MVVHAKDRKKATRHSSDYNGRYPKSRNQLIFKIHTNGGGFTKHFPNNVCASFAHLKYRQCYRTLKNLPEVHYI